MAVEISVTTTGATDAIKCSSVSFTNVVQTSTLGVTNTAVGSTANPSGSITTGTNNSVIIGGIHRYSANALTVGSPFTNITSNGTPSTAISNDYYIKASAGSQTLSYTRSGTQDWAMALAEFKPDGTITYDAKASGAQSGYIGGTTVKWNHTCTGSKLILVVYVGLWQDVAGTGSVSGVTYNGSSFTKATAVTTGAMRSEIWYLVNPTGGSGTNTGQFFAVL